MHENTLYQEHKKDLYTCWREVDIPEALEDFTGFSWDGPKIPYDLWTYIVLFHRYSVEKLDSETLNFLFFDANNTEEPWQCWVPPQTSRGMTVESDPENPLYSKERKNYHNLQFGTVHNHVDMSAFQSSTDETDELDKEGIHITIGNCLSDTIDIHVRAIIEKQQYDINIWDVVEPPTWLKNVPSKFRRNLVTDIFSISLDDYDKKSLEEIYDPELKKVEKPLLFKKNAYPNHLATGDHLWETDAKHPWELDSMGYSQIPPFKSCTGLSPNTKKQS